MSLANQASSLNAAGGAASTNAANTPTVRQNGNPGWEQIQGTYDDQDLLAMWETMRHECFDNRWIFERQWQRNIWYVLGRQWIEYQSKYGGWRDKRMAAWIPRPVTNKCKETVQAVRAMFASINLNVNVRPNGSDPKNVAAAKIADDMFPLLYETHNMDQSMSEFDFWLLVTGNAFLHAYIDYDIKNGMLTIKMLQCQACGDVIEESKLKGASPICPTCKMAGAANFGPALDETGQPIEPKQVLKGMPSTMVLSPLEIAMPNAYTRFDDVPYVVRSRWRTRRYYESHPDPQMQQLASTISWQKSPQDHSMALFTSLVQTNDLGITPIYWSEGSGRGGQNDEGVTEYEVWMKPTAQYPDGLVFRIVGDNAGPKIVHLDEESLPGPLPYKDADGNPLFTFTHATFEHVGGRIMGSGPLDQIIQKQDQLNQLDSQILLCLQRMANPVWLEPKGAEIQKLTGMPGLVIKWNPLTVGGQAKPERIAGIPIDASLMKLREQYLSDIEELSGTFDILKGQRPAGVEAFSAIQALIERSQARFASVFKSRGKAVRNWYKFAIELERAFGPDERVHQVMTPARTWTYQIFKNTQLQGSVSVVVEDGSQQPKTNLGMRAAVEHANSLGLLNMKEPETQYEGLKLFGLTSMMPSMDIAVQSALKKQQAFEDWINDPKALAGFQQAFQAQTMQFEQAMQAQEVSHKAGIAIAKADPNAPVPKVVPIPPPDPLALTPLAWKPWWNAQVHLNQFIKWTNDDAVDALLVQPQKGQLVTQLLTAHMQQIQQNMPQAPAEPPKVNFSFSEDAMQDPEVRQYFEKTTGVTPSPVPEKKPEVKSGGTGQPGEKPAGAGRAMKNSNDNSAPVGNKAQPEPGLSKAA
jgi:hypothetical protein